MNRSKGGGEEYDGTILKQARRSSGCADGQSRSRNESKLRR